MCLPIHTAAEGSLPLDPGAGPGLTCAVSKEGAEGVDAGFDDVKRRRLEQRQPRMVRYHLQPLIDISSGVRFGDIKRSVNRRASVVNA